MSQDIDTDSGGCEKMSWGTELWVSIVDILNKNILRCNCLHATNVSRLDVKKFGWASCI